MTPVVYDCDGHEIPCEGEATIGDDRTVFGSLRFLRDATAARMEIRISDRKGMRFFGDPEEFSPPFPVGAGQEWEFCFAYDSDGPPPDELRSMVESVSRRRPGR